MKKIIILFFTILTSVPMYSQDWIWGIKATGNPQYSEDTDIAVDHEGNVVIAGYYQLGLTLGSFSLYTTDDYYSDIYLCRMDSQHNIQWLKHIETGSTYDYGIGVTIDDDKNIYLTGGMNGRIFASKYDSLGNQLWLCDFNQNFYGQGNDIAIDQLDNVYITGKNSGNTFVAKLDYDGNVVWTKQFIGCNTNGCQGNDIAVDEFGTIYLAGTFECDSLMIDNFKVKFKYSWGDQTFVTKISTQGKVLWAISPNGATNSIPQIALTRNGFYLCSSATTPIDFGGIILNKVAGGNDGNPFIARYDSNGKIIKAKIGNTYLDGVGTTRDFVTDLDDNIYLTGEYFGYYGGSEMDFYVEKYDSSLLFRWNKLFQSSVGEYSHGIGIDASGYSYIVGYSQVKDFIGKEMISSMPTSVGVAKLSTNSKIRLRPYRPILKRFNIICDGGKIDDLYAKGVNVKWYNDPYRKELMHEGNSYKPTIDRTDTFYVTQTIAGVESWPKEVIVHFSELSNAKLAVKNDTVFVTNGKLFKYQWLYQGDTIRNAINNYILPDTIGNYSVIITEGGCQKILDTTFITNTLVKNLKEVSSILYPNPTKGKVSLIVKNDHIGKIKIRVTNLKGDMVFHKESDGQDSYLIEFIDLSSYPSGIYLIDISGNNINKTMKVLHE